MDAIDNVFDPLRDFAKDSLRLVKRCHKPDRKEFTKVAFRTAIGFVVMGFVGCRVAGFDDGSYQQIDTHPSTKE
ncbi:hypothetical protein WN944_010335 [Citrus x changshan-huyou]|uniref:Uncharacterized protein n=1 Tax=Citrus x changshan-huyou TaxID=2935761 RepID=A0AAP0MTH1_9ROSI